MKAWRRNTALDVSNSARCNKLLPLNGSWGCVLNYTLRTSLSFSLWRSYNFNVMKYTKKGSHTHIYVINTTSLVSLVIITFISAWSSSSNHWTTTSGKDCNECELKVLPVYATKVPGRVELWLHSFLPSAVSSHFHAPQVLTPEIKPAVSSEEEDGWVPDTVWAFSRREENGTPNSRVCNECLT